MGKKISLLSGLISTVNQRYTLANNTALFEKVVLLTNPSQRASTFSFNGHADVFKCTDDEVLAPALRILRMYGDQQEYRSLLRQALCDSPKDFLSLVNNPKTLLEATQIQAFQLLADICCKETNLAETFRVFFDPKLCSPCKQMHNERFGFILFSITLRYLLPRESLNHCFWQHGHKFVTRTLGQTLASILQERSFSVICWGPRKKTIFFNKY